MHSWISVFCGVLLVFAFFVSKSKRKSLAILILIVFYILDLSINKTIIGDWASEGTRFYLANSFHELFLVMFLHLKPCKETAVIMMLALLSVLVNMLGFIMYVSDMQNDDLVSFASISIFIVMIIILINERIADCVYRRINRLSAIRSYCTDYLKIHTTRTR